MSFSSFLRKFFLIDGASQPFKIALGRKRWQNLLIYSFESRFYPILPHFYPLTLMIEISTACNLLCPRCERQATNKDNLKNFTSLDTVRKIIPILPYVYSVYLVAGLGENFLNPYFWQIVKIFKKTGVKVGYFTNGVLLNQENIQKTFREKVDSVLVSFDSLKKEKFEQIRKGAKYEEVLANLKNLLLEKEKRKAKNLSVGINFAAQKSTIEEMPKVVDFGKNLGLDFIYFTFLIAHRQEFISETLFDYDKEKLKKIFAETKNLAKKLKIAIRLPSFELDKSGICHYPWREMTIFYNGDVSPCPHFRQAKKYYFIVKNGKLIQKETPFPSLIVGNIYKESILDIWKNKKYCSLRKNFKKNSLELPCRLCYFRFGFH